MVRFELAGKHKDGDLVFLTYKARKYKKNTTIFHNNDYHSIIEIDNKTFKEHFRYERLSGIYRNRNSLTWRDLKEIATVNTYKL